MNFFYLDFETRSRLDLKKVGARNYAEHESTKVIATGYAHNDDPVRHLKTIPKSYIWPGVDWYYVVHNLDFEQAILRWLFGVKPKHWIDTMALAAQMSLPLNLKELAAFFGFAKGDTRVVKKLSKPRRPSKDNADEFWERDTKPDDFEELDEYNKNDVEVMRACHKRMLDLTPKEKRIWALTHTMNERGVAVDIPALNIALPLLDSERTALTAKFLASTGCSPRSPVKLAKFFGLPNSKVQTIKAALKEKTISKSHRSLLEQRQILGRSSVGKLEALRQRTSSDGLLRGSLVYGGASRTLRWSSRGVQLQNLTRGMGVLTDDAFNMLHSGRLTRLLELAPEMVRGFFLGPFIIGDYSQIEARLLAWLAKDTRQIQEWADGVDLYRRMASRIYSKPEKDVTDHERFIGKNTVLGCGYGMGGTVRNGKPSKFQSQLSDKFGVVVSPELSALAVNTYRQVYSNVVQLWYELERAFRRALNSQSGRADAYGVGFERKSISGVQYILVILPSGRRLYYAHPRTGPTGELSVYSARREYAHGAGQDKLYGGKIVENIIQASARDLMAGHMLEMEEERFILRLTVHDELAANDDGRVDKFKAMMQKIPEWATGLPLAVEVFQAQRYRK